MKGSADNQLNVIIISTYVLTNLVIWIFRIVQSQSHALLDMLGVKITHASQVVNSTLISLPLKSLVTEEDC